MNTNVAGQAKLVKPTKAEKQLKQQTEVDKNGYTNQNLFLVQHGFKKLKKNLKALLKFKGDQQLALNELKEKLAKKQEKKELNKDKQQKGENEADFSEQNKQLVAMGFLKVKKNNKLLSKHNGNVQAVAEQLTKKKQLKAQVSAQGQVQGQGQVPK